MKPRNLVESFNVAIEGLLYALRTQRNLKIHFFIALMVVVMSFFWPLDRMEKIILIMIAAFVIIVEMINTAIEKTIDLITEEYHPLAAIAKNVAAGAVLVSAFAAAVVGYIIFVGHISLFLHNSFLRITHEPPVITLIVLIIVCGLVVAGKSYFKRGTFLKGGMPSGHAALSFALGTSVILLAGKQSHPLVALLTLLICLLVAESRIEGGTHTITEVLAGAVLGILVAALFFQVFV